MKRISKLIPKKFYEIDPRIERLARDKQSSFFGPICKVQRKWSVVDAARGIRKHTKVVDRYSTIEQQTLKNVNKLSQYQHLLSLRVAWWSKFSSIFKYCCPFIMPVLIRHRWQLKTAVFLHRCLICAVLLLQNKVWKDCKT